ncbi:alpha/beta hydrolase [Alicyclobacillus sp. ALC3]|uniref:alpha/beta hydrolase n=1 Tax=Alicyclobacillus sp. ALC3 TaxID=2796143 RepID=UPI002378BDBB|nr:alpha/beta fold hydrolase [Alicyclobacillus sp. ALC3]WDL95309.1 alpha/beta fold hydrolase [Alicyclobacillus sp. ALC3]
MKVQVSIPSGSRTLRGIVHTPDAETIKAVVCIYPGLGGTKVGPHRLLVQISNALEAVGVASVRFDLTGQGESDGEFHEISSELWEEDVQSIFRYIEDSEQLSGLEVMTLGFSLGGIVAAKAAASRADLVTGIIMMSPALNVAQLSQDMLKQLPEGAQTVNFAGNIGTRDGAEAYAKSDPTEGFQHIRAPILMLNGTADSMVPKDVYRAFAQKYVSEPGIHLELEGANHSFSDGNFTGFLTSVIGNFARHRQVIPNQ